MGFVLGMCGVMDWMMVCFFIVFVIIFMLNVFK